MKVSRLLAALLLLSGCGAVTAPGAGQPAGSPPPPAPAAPPAAQPSRAPARLTELAIPAPPQSVKILVAPDPDTPIGLMMGSIQPDLERRFAENNVVADQQDAYTSTLTLDGLVSFYQDAMSERGWLPAPSGGKMGAGNAFMAFEAGANGALIMLFDLVTFGEPGVLVMTTRSHAK